MVVTAMRHLAGITANQLNLRSSERARRPSLLEARRARSRKRWFRVPHPVQNTRSIAAEATGLWQGANATRKTTVTDFGNFGVIEPEKRDLIFALIQDADSEKPAFMSFMNVWMAFNGWMAAVTEQETDAAMVRDLATSQRLIRAYDELMARSARFHGQVLNFAAMWPVRSVRDVRKKLGRDAFWRLEPDALVAACENAKVKQQPPHWQIGATPTWGQLLNTIYQVRCNLFHGEKSPQNRRDRGLVLKSDRILRDFIANTGSFNWGE
jgi:hypothetical protein